MNENLLWRMLLESKKILSRQGLRCSLSQRVSVPSLFLYRTSVICVNLFFASTTYGPHWTVSLSMNTIFKYYNTDLQWQATDYNNFLPFCSLSLLLSVSCCCTPSDPRGRWFIMMNLLPIGLHGKMLFWLLTVSSWVCSPLSVSLLCL